MSEEDKVKEEMKEVFHRCLNCGSQDGYETDKLFIDQLKTATTHTRLYKIKKCKEFSFNLKICKSCGFVHLFKDK